MPSLALSFLRALLIGLAQERNTGCIASRSSEVPGSAENGSDTHEPDTDSSRATAHSEVVRRGDPNTFRRISLCKLEANLKLTLRSEIRRRVGRARRCVNIEIS